MPGPARVYGAALAAAVDDGRVPDAQLDAIVERWLRVDRPARAPGTTEPTGRGVDRPAGAPRRGQAGRERRLRAARQRRHAAARSTSGDLRVALIGPRVDRVHMMGGGSAQLVPHHRTSLLDVLRPRLGDRLVFEPG